jgi:hypothetical protein
MKFGKHVLLQIVAIVQEGLVDGKDISQQLRDVEVVVDPGDPDRVTLDPEYFKKHRKFDT